MKVGDLYMFRKKIPVEYLGRENGMHRFRRLDCDPKMVGAIFERRAARGLSTHYPKCNVETGCECQERLALKKNRTWHSPQPQPPAEDPYPQHTALAQVKRESQVIGEFIDWLRNEKKIQLALWVPETDDMHAHLASIFTPINELLAEYFEIDLHALELEKLAMLQKQRQLISENTNNG
jgi:hypothetical protein